MPTLSYRSPEMLLWRDGMSEAMWSESVDVWSWGWLRGRGVRCSVLFVELLSGRYLHEGDSEIAALNLMIHFTGTSLATVCV